MILERKIDAHTNDFLFIVSCLAWYLLFWLPSFFTNAPGFWSLRKFERNYSSLQLHVIFCIHLFSKFYNHTAIPFSDLMWSLDIWQLSPNQIHFLHHSSSVMNSFAPVFLIYFQNANETCMLENYRFFLNFEEFLSFSLSVSPSVSLSAPISRCFFVI